MTVYIKFAKKDHVGIITLNRPDKLNAFTSEMYKRIGEILDEVKTDDDIHVSILEGEGRAFSSGFDINEQVADVDAHKRLRFIHDTANANRWKIWNMDKPVIAKIHGYCLGGALELILPCDFIYAAEDTIIGEPEIQFGATPAFLVIPWIIGLAKAKELLLLGKKITGTEAEQIGLVTRAVPLEDLDSTVSRVVEALLKLPQSSIRLLKRGINRIYEIQGLKGAIDGWVDSTVLVNLTQTYVRKKFAELVAQDDLSAALKWLDNHYKEGK
jgi:enoyl-CoA hydratase/carnithine racemase